MSKGDIEYLCLLLLLVAGSCLFFGLLYVGLYIIIRTIDFILRGLSMDKKKKKKKDVYIVVNGSVVREPKCNECNYCECETCPTWHGETLENDCRECNTEHDCYDCKNYI